MSQIEDDDLLDMLDMVEPKAQSPAEAPSQASKPTPVSAAKTEDEGDDLGAFLDAAPLIQAAPPPAPQKSRPPEEDEGDDLASFVQSGGFRQEKTVDYKRRPWMDEHKFVLVKTMDELRKLVDQCLANGKASIDLETQGLDNRIYWRDSEDFTDRDRQRNLLRIQDKSEIWEGFLEQKGKLPETVHKIVGYCICPDGLTGYYVPIRHKAEDSNNLSAAEAAQEIRRLCLASQPKLTEDGMRDDPLASRSIAEPGKVKLFFWHAKFDQEFLFPITGLEFWHPESFEDGNLFYFCKYTNDKALSLKDKAPQELRTKKGHPYEMIEIKELFVSSSGKKREIDFASLHPTEAYEYGASDSICTYLLCDKPENVAILKDVKTPKHVYITAMYRLEKQVAQALRGMERCRIQLDIEYVRNLFKEATDEAAKYEAEVQEVAKTVGWHNLDLKSSKALSEFLFTEKGLNIEPKPPINEASGQYKTDADTLEALVENHAEVNPVLKTIVKFRQVDKVIGTYLTSMVNNCDSNSEIRYQFKQTGAATARFSAPAGQPEHGYSGVPIHGIPATYDDKKPKVATSLRKAFKARTGFTMVKVDFAGEELRIATNLSQEPVWIDEFLNGSGDLHTITARAFFNKQEVTKQERQMGKCVHPDTLVVHNGTYKEIRTVGQFGEEDTFMGASGTIFDGSQEVKLQSTYNGGEKELVHVVTSSGIVTCTPQHKFLLRDGSWVQASALKKGDLLAEVQTPKLQKGQYPTIQMPLWEGLPHLTFQPSHALAYFAGLYAGDGTGSASSASLTHGKAGVLDDYGMDYAVWIRVLEEACSQCGFTTTHKDKDALYLGSTVFVRFLSVLGMHRKRSKLLRIPFWVFRGGLEAGKHYLGGLFDTDGTVGGGTSPNLDWTTKDFVFAGQVATLLKACGFDFNTELTFNKTYRRYYVRLRLTVASSWKLREYLRYPGKVARLRPPILSSRTKDRFIVVSVQPAGVGSCLDLSVQSDEHRYLANGFITHNTANFALLYGGGAASIVRATGCSQVEAQRRKQNFDKALPSFAKWTRNQKALCHKEKGVWTAFKRWIAVPEIDSQEKPVVAGAERASINYPVQGCNVRANRILTNFGYLSIGYVVENPNPEYRVWTGTSWAPFKVMPMGEWERARINLFDGTRLECDTRHKVIRVTDEGYEWAEYEDLKPGDRIASPLYEAVQLVTPTPLEPGPLAKVDVEFWYWIGRYYGDGFLGKELNTLTYCFGSHEQASVEACTGFWLSHGFNARVCSSTHQPDVKESTRLTVIVQDKGLHQWLRRVVGLTSATAHTKRLPPRVFAETLDNRKSFMRGLMDSDGHKPSIVGAKGNPYSVHLCQRELLMDFKLLLRTLGVESVLRGPYTWFDAKKQREFTSFRLDLNRRMYERHVEGRTNVRDPKFHDILAPKFLVDEFLTKTAKVALPTQSGRVLRSRLKCGGEVSVYTLRALAKEAGVELDNPIYAFKRVVSTESLGFKEETYSLFVHDEAHRYEAEGVLHKNTGADIMKIAMVLLHKEFYRRRWLPTQEDKARMLLTVHDEIVFEVRHEVLQEAMEVIVRLMEEPGRMAKWRVPLIAEPLIDETWDAKYDWDKIIKGKPIDPKKPPKDTDIVYEGRVYGKVPKWLEPYVTPPWKAAGMLAPTGSQGATGDSNSPSATPSTAPAQAAPSEAPKPNGTHLNGNGNGGARLSQVPTLPITVLPTQVHNFRILNLTQKSVKQVAAACVLASKPNGPILEVTHAATGEVLVSASLGIRIDPEEFQRRIDEYNL